MRRGNAALTRAEVLAVLFVSVVIILVLVVLLAPMFINPRTPARKAVCKENLAQIGKAINAYSLNYGEYYPFSWMPTDAKAPRKKDAMTSIACLYPEYLGTAEVFRCPSTKHRPSFVLNANTASSVMDENSLPDEGSLTQNGRFTLTGSSYGYDCRLSPIVASGHAIAADMDGSYDPNRDTHTANHLEGQNVLYADGGVRWVSKNFCSNDPNDNIFAEGGIDETGPYFWHADTDSFISDNTPPGSDSTPGAFNDLSASYDGYPDLHP